MIGNTCYHTIYALLLTWHHSCTSFQNSTIQNSSVTYLNISFNTKGKKTFMLHQVAYIFYSPSLFFVQFLFIIPHTNACLICL